MSPLVRNLLISLLSVVLFLIVSVPFTYQITNKLLGKIVAPTASEDGQCPTTYGLFIHAVVFFLLVLGSMYIPWGKLSL
jgi:hypothetical protein